MKTFSCLLWILLLSLEATSQQPNLRPLAGSAPQSFTLSPDKLGDVSSSVNLFTGDLSFPINLVSLPGRNGLDVSVPIVYSSNVARQANTWNAEAPTGVVGLGWSFDFPKILVDNKMTGTREDDTYYIAEGGGSNKLIFTGGTASTGKKYAAKNYQFWVITFYPNDEKWEIIKEDGTKYVYGDKNSGRSTVQWIVTWNNWIGDSNVTTSTIQKQQGFVWNLSEIVNIWGEKIRFTYLNVNQKVGSSAGKEHTEASYLTTITDVLGRTVNLVYADKGSAEYYEPHTENGIDQIDAYQERYERKFLDYINVNDTDGVLLSSIDLAYTTMGTGNTTKRLLSSVVQYNSTGQSLPGHSFQYITSYSPTVNFGALSSITTPAGGVINYTYAQQIITRAVREKKVTAIAGYAEPKVWIGPDYVVVTRRQLSGSSHTASARTVKIQAISWNGEWLDWDLNEEISNITVTQEKNQWEWETGDFNNANKYKLQDFHVTLQRDFFAVISKTSATMVFDLRIYKRQENKIGSWAKFQVGNINLGTNFLQNVDLVSGENFVGISSAGLNSISIFKWNGTTWTSSTISRTGSYFNRLVAGHNYLISHSSTGHWGTPLPDNIQFFFFKEDESVVTRTISSLPDNSTAHRSHWYPSASFALVMADDNNEYFFVWDENFNVTRKNLGHGLNDQSYVSIINNSMVTIVDPSVTANYAARYNGDNFIISANLDATLGNAVDPNTFTMGEDFVIRPKSGSSTQVGLTYFNPNTNAWSNLLFSSANKLTARAGYKFFVKTHSTDNTKAEIVYRNSSGFSTDPTSLVITNLNTNNLRYPWQAGHNFVIKNRGIATGSPFLGIGESIMLTNGKINPSKPDFTTGTGFNATSGDNPGFHWSGTFDHTPNLVGGDVIVSFLNESLQFDATEVKLFKLIDQAANDALKDFAVQKVSVNDGTTTTHSFLAYDLARATYDATGSVAQYNKVSIYPGMESVNTANGSMDYYFYNGIKNSEAAAPFPSASDDDFMKMLVGSSYRSNLLDNTGNIVSYSVSFPALFSKTIQQGTTPVALAYYVRPVKTWQSTNGSFITEATLQYNANGLPSIKSVNTGSSVFSEEYKYWYQEYDPTLTKNILTRVIQTKRTAGSFVDCSVVKYKNWGTNNVPAPYQTYTWKKTGSSDFSAWAIGATPSADWRLVNTIDGMDATKGLVYQTTAIDGTVSKTIWDAAGKHVLATVSLPQNGNVLYKGFEDCTSNCSNEAKTGLKSFNGAPTLYAIPAGTYKVTYWQKPSAQADWQFVESSFTGDLYSVPHTWVDELRIAPADARIVSYSYDRYGNVISVCDENNLVSYKEYDEFNRPKITRDQDRKIVELTKYNINN